MMVANPADADRRHEHDPADDAIAGVFALLRESLHNPDPVRSLPDNAVVEFRTVDIGGHRFALTAAKGEGSEVWTARPYRHTLTRPTQVRERPAGESRDAIQDPDILLRRLYTTGRSGSDALDALTRTLTDAIDRGLPKAPGR
jgi:hypothetical protein